MRAAQHVLILAAASLLSACCTTGDLVVILPASDGHIGGVVVEASGNKVVLDKAYAAAAGAAPVQVSEMEVERIFSGALSARPIPAKSYTLYFQSGSDALIPESATALEAMFAEMSERKAVEIVITGHTDTVGPAGDNDRLSRDRARAVETQLRARFGASGVKADAISTAGRGERALLVQTPDQTAEPRNRRVEITVR